MRKSIFSITLALLIFICGFVNAAPNKPQPGSSDVTVVNTALNPVPVVVGNAKEIVNIKKSCTVLANTLNCFTDTIDPVPEGKRLVIEYLSCRSDSSPGGTTLSCGIRTHEQEGEITNISDALFLTTSPTALTDGSTITVGQPVKIYLASGDSLDFLGIRNNTVVTEINVEFMCNGYYEALP